MRPTKKAGSSARKGPADKAVPAKPSTRHRPRGTAKPVYITEDEADVLVSRRRERDEELVPWEQVQAELAELD